MPHKATFHLNMHRLLTQNRSSEKEIRFFGDIMTCNPSIYTMEHPDHTASQNKKNMSLDMRFQQCDMCDQQKLRSACVYAQFDQSLC